MRISDWSSDVCSSDLALSRRDHVEIERLYLPDFGQLAIGRTGARDGDVDILKLDRQLVGPAFSTIGGNGLQPPRRRAIDRKSVVSGKSVSVRLDLGGPRPLTTKTQTQPPNTTQ